MGADGVRHDLGHGASGIFEVDKSQLCGVRRKGKVRDGLAHGGLGLLLLLLQFEDVFLPL